MNHKLDGGMASAHSFRGYYLYLHFQMHSYLSDFHANGREASFTDVPYLVKHVFIGRYPEITQLLRTITSSSSLSSIQASKNSLFFSLSYTVQTKKQNGRIRIYS